MRKLETNMTLAAGIFQDKAIDLIDKKDVYIYGIMAYFAATPTDLAADEFKGVHVSTRDLTALTLDVHTPICIVQGVITAAGIVDLTILKIFNKPIKYSSVQKLYVGAQIGAACEFNCVLLVSEKNIAY